MIATAKSKAAGAARVKTSRKALDRILAGAAVPLECGPEIIPAPARGRILAVVPVETRRDAEAVAKAPDEASADECWTWEACGHKGRMAVRALDQFEAMNKRARRAGLPDEFTPPQVEAARLYRAMIEKHSAGAVKCVSLEAQGGGGGGGFIDAYLDTGRMITAMSNAIGGGAALELRRVRPSDRGNAGARIIRAKVLVDAVCLYDEPLSAILAAFGWSDSARNRDALKASLWAALGRLSAFI